ncbi:unnamed protein product [Prorocentrum cordatum]|uniref:PSII 6.1 kDa protein n=1 Tax=Prorocentrum cordatum TaxID=2364126 RepID=A0ABN9WT97_9DINO|nr:unnamed protein product [Polarella glacialis]|mmetsp:Transcript_25445/g.66429  ORF Transcript_25445/g.66429 Transcript_25445/m.66429 type:complete len:118 (+) Transcript_25445:75-428(+)
MATRGRSRVPARCLAAGAALFALRACQAFLPSSSGGRLIVPTRALAAPMAAAAAPMAAIAEQSADADATDGNAASVALAIGFTFAIIAVPGLFAWLSTSSSTGKINPPELKTPEDYR